MTPSKDIQRLIEIMVALRDRQTGCPWDIEQDFSTIAPYTVEEAYEVADAIERNDPIDLREELGDLLLQVVYHSQLAAEAGLFDFGSVVETVTSKMIRRHPHVFGDAEARSARSAKGQWERIKAEEKAERQMQRETTQGVGLEGQAKTNVTGKTGLLDEIPSAFPALTLALKVQKKAATVGFDWGDPAPIYGKIDEEIAEFRQAVAADESDEREAELGDLVFSVVNLARYYEVDPEKALRRCVRKFRDRFGFIETELGKSGGRLETTSLDEMESLWVTAKQRAVRKVS